jgi:hypothetical protein
MKNWVASDIKMKLREERDAKIASRGLDRTSLQSNLEEMQNLNKVRAVASPFFSEESIEAEATMDPRIDMGALPSNDDESNTDESLIETYEQKNTGGEGNE